MCIYISPYTHKKRGIHDQSLEPSRPLIPTATSPGHHFQGALVESQSYYKRESLTPPEPREDPNQGACFNRDHVGTRPRCKQPVRQLMCRLDLTVDWVMPSFLLLRYACYDDRTCMFFIPTPDRIPRLCFSQPSTRRSVAHGARTAVPLAHPYYPGRGLRRFTSCPSLYEHGVN
jgi:hypothetical protein